MNKQAILLLIVICLFASCTRVSFLYPISESGKHRVLKKELIGEWNGKEDKSFKVIIDTSMILDSLYSITIIDTTGYSFADTSYLSGELFSLQNRFFMSVSTNFNDEKKQQIGLYNAATILPSFQVIRIYSLTPDSIQFGQLNGDTLLHLIKTKKIVLKNEMIRKDDILILERSGGLEKKLIELEKFATVYDKTTLYRAK